MNHRCSFSNGWRGALCAALGLVSLPVALLAQTPPAFPGALGFGAVASGGRAGSVYHVTNLNDSGAGSFRDAVSGSNRTIVFDVGGYITLKSAVSCQGSLTIAGQTAPGGGIGIKNYEVSFAGRSNIICRFVRIRPGSPSPSSDDCLSFYQANTIICDHTSLEFAKWNNIDAVGDSAKLSSAITVQNSIIANPIGQQFGAHTESVGGTFSWFYNLFANSHNRNPLAKVNTIFVNNVHYNNSAGYTTHTSTPFKHDIVNNLFIHGPASGSNSPWYQIDNNQSIYASGNLKDTDKNGALNGSSSTPLPGYQGGGTMLATPWSPTLTAAGNVFTATSALPYVLSQAGALPRDEMDGLVVNQTMTLGKGTTGTGVGTVGPDGGLYTSEAQTGLSNAGFGTLASGTALADADKDGMPDVWENALGWNPAADDHTTQMASSGGVITGPTFFPANTPSGYTRLEEYLHFMASAHAIVPKSTAATPTFIDIDLRAYAAGYTVSPTFTVSGVSGGTAVQTGTGGYSVRFAPTTNAVGRAMFSFKVQDSAGNQVTQPFYLLISATGLPRDLAWVGDNSTNVWDTAAPMWNKDGAMSAFNSGDNAAFDDSGSANPVITVASGVSVSSMSVNAIKNYTFGGGGLSILGSLSKDGAGTLTLNVANSIAGGVTLNGGAITQGVSGALGAGAMTLNAGTLNIGATAITNALVIPADASPTIIGGSSGGQTGIGGVTGAGTLNLLANNVFDLRGDMSTFSGAVVFTGGAGIRINGSTGSSLATFDLGNTTTGISVRSTATSILLGALKGGANTTLGGAGGGSTSLVTYTIGGNGASTQFDGKIVDGANGSTVYKTSVTKTGGGTLTLTNTANAYTGLTTISGGTLAMKGAAPGAVTVASGGTLSPGGANAAATLTAGTGFTFSGGSIAFDLSADPVSGANDKIVVSGGTLTLSSSGSVKVNLTDGVLGAGTYSLISGNATMGASNTTPVLSASIPATGTRQTFAIMRGGNNAANGFLSLVVTGNSGNLTWTGANGSAWDLQTASNWNSAATTGNPNLFYNFDIVNFTDAAASGAVTLSGSIQPNVINVSGNTLAYNFSGSGTIDGPGKLVKSGAGTLTISNTGANTYTGGTFLSGGTLAVSNAAGLGSGALNISGGKLSLAAIALPNSVVFSGSSAIASTSGNIGIAGTATSTMTSVGNATVDLSGVASLLTINGDMSGFSGALTFGASGGFLRLNGSVGSASALFDLGTGSATLGNRNGGLAIDLGAVQGGPNTTLQGRQTAGADVTATDYYIGALNTDNVFAGKIVTGFDQGGVNITKEGTGNWTLSGTSNFSGNIVVDQGTLTVSGALTNDGDFEAESGATLALSGGTINTSLVSITPGAVLTGCGTLNADLVNQGTVTVNCGGALTVTGSVENDGRMTVNNGSTLAISGSFVNNGVLDILTSPQTTLPANFVNNGTVIYSQNLAVQQVVKTGTDMQIAIQSYTGHTYQLQRTDTLSPANWQPVAGQTASGTGGVLTFTDAGGASAARRFYRIQAAP